jgi:hypothetical protein
VLKAKRQFHQKKKKGRGVKEEEKRKNPGIYIHVPTFWDTESFSAGRLRSFSPAATRHHFMRGAQKNTVFGPVQTTTAHRCTCQFNLVGYTHIFSLDAPAGWFMNDWNREADALAAAPDIFGSKG